MIKRTMQSERTIDADSACIEEKPHDSRFVDFISQDGCCHGFPLVQLVHCVLERNPASQGQTAAPPDRLTLAFTTRDVVILGWNLRGVRDALDISRPVIVRVRDPRYAKLENRQPFVSGISVRTGEQSQMGDLA